MSVCLINRPMRYQTAPSSLFQGFDIKIGTGSAPDRDSDDDIDPGFKFPFRPAAGHQGDSVGLGWTVGAQFILKIAFPGFGAVGHPDFIGSYVIGETRASFSR